MRASRLEPVAQQDFRPAAQLVALADGGIDVEDIEVGLSAREHQVARLLATGQTTASAGAALGISAHTARRHAERVYAKLGVHNRAALGALLARVDDGPPATEPAGGGGGPVPL